MPNLISWTLLAAIVSLVSHNVESAVTHRRPSLEAKETHQITIDYANMHEDFPYSRRFIISTNRDQIKLYSFLSRSSSDLNISNNYYILKPADLNLTLNELGSLVKKRPISYNKWLLEKKLKSNVTRKASILPGDEAEEYYSDKTDYFKPIISHVDYFYSLDFCKKRGFAGPRDCLVVVWTDTRNNLIHYGSVNLLYNNIRSIGTAYRDSSRRANTNRILFMNTFPPISFEEESLYSQKQINGMVVDRKLRRLHVIYSVGLTAQRVLSGRFKAIDYRRFLEDSHTTELHEEQLFNIETPRGDQSNISSINTMGSEIDIGLDERNNGDWLFYRSLADQNIHVLSTYSKWLGLGGGLLHKAYTNNCGAVGKIISLAVDFRQTRILLLTDQLEVYSTGFNFLRKKLLGKLPLDRSVVPYTRFKMQISHDTLFIADSTKKTVAAYRLDLGPRNESTDDMFLTRQVLLVETPYLSDFRYIEEYFSLHYHNWNQAEDDTFRKDQDELIDYYKKFGGETILDKLLMSNSKYGLIRGCITRSIYYCTMAGFLDRSDIDEFTYRIDSVRSVAPHSICRVDYSMDQPIDFSMNDLRLRMSLWMLLFLIMLFLSRFGLTLEQGGDKSDVQVGESSVKLEKSCTEKGSHIDKSKLVCNGALMA